MKTNTCEFCKQVYTPSSKTQRFCSRSCANRGRDRSHLEGKYCCKYCKAPVPYWRSYCDDHKYGHGVRYEKFIKDWLDGKESGVRSGGLDVSDHIKRYIMIRAEGKCELCGFDKVHPKDGRSILELDHIDGNHINNSPTNLRYICPNCHALTDTYKARNTGNGRLSRRLRYHKDKSRVDRS